MIDRPGMPPTPQGVLRELANLFDAMDDIGMFGEIPQGRDREIQHDLRGLAVWFDAHPDLAAEAFDAMRSWTLR